MVGEDEVPLVPYDWVVVDRRIQVKQDGQVNRLLGVQELVLKAETLDLVEVGRHLIRVNLVHSDTCNGLIRPIVDLVEG